MSDNIIDRTRVDVQTLEDVDGYDDLPDVTEASLPQVYSVRTGDMAPDYIVPWGWDGEKYQEWRSVVDGGRLAIPDTVVEDFERPDPLDDYTGDTGAFSVHTSDPIEGDQSLESENSNFNHIYTGEREPIPKGKSFSIIYEARTDTSAMDFAWGSSGVDEGYRARIQVRDDHFELTRRSPDTTFDDESVELPAQGYELLVDWHDGSGSEPDNTMIATLYEFNVDTFERGVELAQLSAQDDIHASNTGFNLYTYGDSPTENIYDYIVIWGDVE